MTAIWCGTAGSPGSIRRAEAGVTSPRSDGSDDDLLPDVTADERSIGWGDDLTDDEAAEDRRLAEDRPPHWDGD